MKQKLDDSTTIWLSIEHLLKVVFNFNKRIKILEKKLLRTKPKNKKYGGKNGKSIEVL